MPESFELDPAPIKEYFKSALKQAGSQGDVKACIVMPDLSKLFEIDSKKEELLIRRFMFQRYPPASCLHCFASKSYLDQEAFEQQVHKYETESKAALSGKIVGTTTAFVVFDSIETLQVARSTIRNKYLDFVSNTVGIPLDSMYSKIKNQAGAIVNWNNQEQLSALNR